MPAPYPYGHWNAARTKRSIAPHTNEGLELVYVSHGEVTWDYEGTHVTVPAGHLSYTWPWQLHAARDEQLPLVEIYWLVLPLRHADTNGAPNESVLQFAAELPCSAESEQVLTQLQQLQQPKLKMRAAFRTYFTRLIEQLKQTEGHFDLEASGWLQLSLAEIGRAIESVEQGDAKDQQRERVRQFLETHLPDHAAQAWTLDQMAHHCGLGRSSFTESVKELSGDTPIRMLARARIAKAQSLLQQTTLPITTIALRCGFGSSQHFATVFKNYTSLRPTDYRHKDKQSVG
jgi:AraC family L-rhamnose operon regulatory protein RhaS